MSYMPYLICMLALVGAIAALLEAARRLNAANAEIRRLNAHRRITREERDHAIAAARRAQVKVAELLQARHDTPGEASGENTGRSSDHATG